MSPTLSVIMPSYNHAAFVAQAIQSVLDQSFADFEFIILDDASTDDSVSIIRGFSDSRIRFISLPSNIGLSAALNTAIHCANGDLVAFHSSDDFYLPHKLALQTEVFKRTPHLAAVFGDCLNVDERGETHHDPTYASFFRNRHFTRHQYLRSFFNHGNSLCATTAIVRRDVLNHIGPFDTRLRRMQDFDYWVRILGKYEIEVLDEQLTAHRWMDNRSNESGPRPEVWAANAWEFRHVLKHYISLDSDLFLNVFADDLRDLDLIGLDRRVQLGRLAVNAPHVSAHALGMDLLYEALSNNFPGITATELQELSSALDIYGVNARNQLAICQNHLLTAREDLMAIRHSRSYRYTEWLRAILRVIRCLQLQW